MLGGARFLRSAVAAFARLAHALATLALMSLCSPRSPSTATVIPAAPWQHHARPAKKLAVEDTRHQPLPAAPPAALFLNKEAKEKKKTAARGRPPRLVIPPPVARAAGVDPFGVAADRETDVATEVEVQGEGFCLASRRGVRHAMEDGYGVITGADGGIAGGSQLVIHKNIFISIIDLLPLSFACPVLNNVCKFN